MAKMWRTREGRQFAEGVAENGGRAAFVCLCTGERIVGARLVDGKYGRVWLLSDAEEAQFGRKFVPTDASALADRPGERPGTRSSVQVKLGLFEAFEMVPARVYENTEYTGGYLGGARTLRAVIRRAERVEYGCSTGTVWNSPEDRYVGDEWARPE